VIKIVTENGRVRYGTLRYGTVLYGTVRYGTVRYGTVRYATLRYATVRYGTLRYATVRYGTLRYATVRYGTLRYATVRYGTLRYATVRYGTLRYATVRYGTVLWIKSLFYPQHRIKCCTNFLFIWLNKMNGLKKRRHLELKILQSMRKVFSIKTLFESKKKKIFIIFSLKSTDHLSKNHQLPKVSPIKGR
jgi:hypothetical protein